MSRCLTITRKVPSKDTGLVGAIYVHVDFTAAGLVDAVKISTPGKTTNTQLERVLDRLGEAVTEIVREAGGG